MSSTRTKPLSLLIHDHPDLLALLPPGAEVSQWTGTWEPLPRIARSHPSVTVRQLVGIPNLRQLLGALLPRRTAVAASPTPAASPMHAA